VKINGLVDADLSAVIGNSESGSGSAGGNAQGGSFSIFASPSGGTAEIRDIHVAAFGLGGARATGTGGTGEGGYFGATASGGAAVSRN